MRRPAVARKANRTPYGIAAERCLHSHGSLVLMLFHAWKFRRFSCS